MWEQEESLFSRGAVGIAENFVSVDRDPCPYFTTEYTEGTEN